MGDVLFGTRMKKYPVRDMGNGKIRCAGVAMAMQGSGISNVDVGSATIKLTEDGVYILIIGAADMGTGCDTILAQMAARRFMKPLTATTTEQSPTLMFR